MKEAALRVSSGELDAKTGVEQADEIGELAVVFDNMVGSLAEALKERGKLDKLRQDFIANISHELRTPITAIRGSLEAVIDGVVSDEEKVTEYHRQMLGECKYLERLVSDLLDLSRLQNIDFAIEAEVIDLRDVVGDVAQTMTKIAGQKNVSLSVSCANADFDFVGDYGRLRQMLIAVVDNAVKLSPEGAVVSISLFKQGSVAHLYVRDRAGGIDPDDIEHIFERFYKQRSEQNKTGTGLGLAIAKQIADRHDISICVSNHSNCGAEFSFTFHLMEASLL